MNHSLTLSAVALATLAALTLAGCVPSDFASDEEKREAFSKYTCKEQVELNAPPGYMYASETIAEAKKNPGSVSDDDLSAAFDVMTVKSNVVKSEWQHHKEDPMFKPAASERVDPLEDGECQGWTWEKELAKSTERDYDDFTYKMAVDSGVIQKN